MAFLGTEIDNGELPNYTIARKTIGGLQYQGVILADGGGGEWSAANPIPVTGMVSVSDPMVTFVPTRPSFTSGASAIVLAANTSRKAGSMIANNTNFTFYLQFGGAAAVNGQGQPLFPGQVWKFNSTQEIRAIFVSSGSTNLDVLEAT